MPLSVIARETLHRIASRKLPPTPENYERIWHEVAGTSAANEGSCAATASRTWGELLAQALRLGVVPQLAHLPELQLDAQALAGEAIALGAAAPGADEIIAFAARLRQFWLALDAHGADPSQIHDGLMRILKILTTNIADLLGEDSWMRGQLQLVGLLADGPLDRDALSELERRLREIAFQQGVLKHSLDQAKDAMKTMIATFVERIGTLASGTAEYHDRLNRHAQRIERAESLAELSTLVVEVMEDTRGVQTELGRSRLELVQAQRTVVEHEARARRLQEELSALSSRLNEDYLTQLLNRRGLSRAFQAESNRADRADRSICVAVLDIDHFKHLNDRLGHAAGDQALVHLARVVRDSLRPSDAIARWGGEEFVILLPDTGVAEAMRTMMRVQRALTRRYFLHNHDRVLITFSAGVAERHAGESQEDVIARADRALYRAKELGRNRVCAAEEDAPRVEPVPMRPEGNAYATPAGPAPARSGSAPHSSKA
jgi:diguanylate cyclase